MRRGKRMNLGHVGGERGRDNRTQGRGRKPRETPGNKGGETRGEASSHEDAGHVGFGANYGGSVGDMKVSLKAAWHHGDKDANDGMALSAALMHSSGLTGGFNYSYTMDGVQALTNAQTTPDPDQHHWYAHVGYKAKFNELGNTYIGGEWQQDRDFTVSGAEGNSIGVGFSQDIDSAAVSFYAKYLHLNVEEPNQSYEDIQAVDTGIRMKF
jgi:hypothetical protein